MAENTSTLRSKGPLTKPKAIPSTKYTEKPTAKGDMKFEMPKKGNKAKQHLVTATPFDSSQIISPFLDPKILERRAMAAKKSQR